MPSATISISESIPFASTHCSVFSSLSLSPFASIPNYTCIPVQGSFFPCELPIYTCHSDDNNDDDDYDKVGRSADARETRRAQRQLALLQGRWVEKYRACNQEYPK